MVQYDYRDDGDVLFGANQQNNFSYVMQQTIINSLNNIKQDISTGEERTADVNLIYNLSTDARTNVDSSTTTASLFDHSVTATANPDVWISCDVADDCNNDSVGSFSSTGSTAPGALSIETGGGVGNNETSYCQHSVSHTAGTPYGTSVWEFQGHDFKASATDEIGILKVYSQAPTPGNTNQFKIGNTVILDIANGDEVTIELHFDYSAETVTAYINGQTSPSATDIDISTETNWYARVHSQSTSNSSSGTCESRFYYIRYINSSGSSVIVMNSDTVGQTVNNMFMYASTDETNGAVTYELSANNGINYSSVNLSEVTNFTNTGTQPKARITITHVLAGSAKYKEHAFLYG